MVQSLQELAEMYKILANPTRLQIFNILMTGMHCNCEIASQTGLPMNLISHHLRVLSEAGLVTADRNTADARWIFYNINQEKLTWLQSANAAFLDVKRIQPREPDCGPCSPKKTTDQSKENME